MINEITNYRCKCNKCNHLWTTKTYDVPGKCPKCKRVTWNEGSEPATRLETLQAPTISQPIPTIQPEPQDALAAFIAKAQAIKGITPGTMIASEPEPIEEVWQFTKDKVWYDEMNTPQRKQWLVGSKATFRIVEVNEFDYDVIERVSKGKA